MHDFVCFLVVIEYAASQICTAQEYRCLPALCQRDFASTGKPADGIARISVCMAAGTGDGCTAIPMMRAFQAHDYRSEETSFVHMGGFGTGPDSGGELLGELC